MEEKKQKDKITELQERQKKDLHTQRRELEQLQAEKDLRVAQARFKAYKQIVTQGVEHSSESNVAREQHCPPQCSSNQYVDEISPPSQNKVSSLVQILQDNINLNRLPTPEPFVFNGDPIQYVEWKASFVSLIDKKSIYPGDKLYYL